MFTILGGIARDLREVRDTICWIIYAATTPETNNVVQYHLPTPLYKSPIELLDQHAKEGNIEQFSTCLQSIITQTIPISQTQFNPDIHIQKLLSNLNTNDANTVIALSILYTSYNSEHIIPKINTIIATLNMAQLDLLNEYPTFSKQIQDRILIIEQESVDQLVMSAHGTRTLEEDDQFVVVGKEGTYTPSQEDTH
jgi:hypothetical protein